MTDSRSWGWQYVEFEVNRIPGDPLVNAQTISWEMAPKAVMCRMEGHGGAIQGSGYVK